MLRLTPLMTSVAATIIIGERPLTRFGLFAVLGAFVVIVCALRDGGGVFDIGDVYLLAGTLTGATATSIRASSPVKCRAGK